MEATQNQVGKFIDPDLIISQLDVQGGSVAADFGCGPGYFSLPFAKAVGTEGHVYSFDVLPQALETVASKSRNLGITNIDTKRANLEKENGSKLENESMDWVILKDVLFQNQKKEIIIAEAYRVLKNGGKVVVVEWNKAQGIGPDMNLRIDEEALKQMFGAQGFSLEKEVNAGDFHYAFVLKK